MRLPWLALALLPGCHASPPSGAPAPAAIPPGAVAQCADRPISAPMVSLVAASRSLSSRQALEALASDARAATEAEQRALHRDPLVRQRLAAVQVRALLAASARQHDTPPTPAELRRIRTEHWLDFDRPEGASVVHAVAIGQGQDAARRVAEAIAEATRGAPDPSSFEERARLVPHPDIEVKIESLPPMSLDGRTLDDSGGTFDRTFAAAALALPAPGAQSPVLATPFGYHVLYLVEHTPASHPDDATLARMTSAEIQARRQSDVLTALVASLRSRESVTIDRDVDEQFRVLDPAREQR